MSNPSRQLAAILDDIQQLHPDYKDAIADLEKKANTILAASGGEYSAISGGDWVTIANKEAMTKLRILMENNFRYIETVGLLATTRYIFECLVWLRLLKADDDYGVVFYYKIIKDQIAHQNQMRKKYEAEAQYFDELSEEESALIERAVKQLTEDDADQETYKQELSRVQGIIDTKARRNFSMYWSDAQNNGLGYQAHLIRTQALTSLDRSLSELEIERQRALNVLTPKQTDMITARWNWETKASDTGMLTAYEFIYSFTSRLLHATPSSMFTNNKNLEESEMVLLFDYILISLMDALDITEGSKPISHE